MLRRGFFVRRHALLYTVEKLFRHDCWNAVWNNTVAVAVLTDVLPVVQHSGNIICVQFAASRGADAGKIESVRKLLHGCSVGVKLKRFQNSRRGYRVDLVLLIGINGVPNR